MGRLTIRIDGEAYIEKVANKYCEEVCSSRNRCNDCPIRDAFNKLAHYEDLEEQGRLIELPIPLWKPYYEITESFNISMYILKPASAGRIIQNGLFGKYVFATKEEAEVKLKELKEGAE